MTSAQVPMVNQKNGQAGLVDADKVESAKTAGFEPAVKMQGPNGATGYVAESKVSAARQSNFSVTPDNPGVQRMATPKGQLTYALPSEVEQFKSSGHVAIDDKGNFQVEPLPGEDNTDTMARAATLAQKLPPDVMKKAIEAEKSTFTAARIAKTLGVAALAGPAIVGAETEGAAAAGAAAIPTARAIGTAAGTAVKLAKTPAGQFIIKKALAPAVGSAIAGAGFGAAAHWVEKWLKQ